MPFDSLQFWLIFLPLVIALTYLPRRSARWQNLVLLIASLIFYTFWTGYFVILLALVTLTNYLFGRLLENADTQRANIICAVAVFCDLLILSLFKYTPIVTSLVPGGSILAPIGISFYIFQNLAYVLEVRRKQIPSIHSILDYAAFSCYFTLVLSGPIERVRHLLPQLQKPRSPSAIPVERALGLIILGLFQKVVLAKIAGDWSVP